MMGAEWDTGRSSPPKLLIIRNVYYWIILIIYKPNYTIKHKQTNVINYYVATPRWRRYDKLRVYLKRMRKTLRNTITTDVIRLHNIFENYNMIDTTKASEMKERGAILCKFIKNKHTNAWLWEDMCVCVVNQGKMENSQSHNNIICI